MFLSDFRNKCIYIEIGIDTLNVYTYICIKKYNETRRRD